MTKKYTVLALLAMSGAQVMAQDVIMLDEITLSANLEETAVNETGATVEVLDAEDIQASQSVTLSDTLGNITGVSVSRSGSIGTNASVVIRGSKQYENKILVDGFDLADPSAPQEYYNFGTGLNLGADRIEVVKGSQSGIYGSGAIGGVVAISNFSDIQEGWHFSGQIEAGSYNTYSEMLKATYGGDRVNAGIVLSGLDTDGFSAADENNGNTEADGSVLRNGAFFLSYDIDSNLTIGANALWEDSEYEYDFASGDGDQTGYKDSSAGRFFLKYDDAVFTHDVSIAVVNTERSDLSVDPVWGTYEAGYETKRLTYKYDLGYQASDNVKLSFGLERQDIEAVGTVSNAGIEYDRDINSIYAGVDLGIGNTLDLGLVARFDDDEFADGQASGRLAMAWRPTDALTVKSSLSTGYRAPSLYELYNAYYGNPDLKIERTLSFDIGVESQINDQLKLGATLFAMNTEDFVGFNYGAGYHTLDGTTKRRGVELSADYEIADNFALSAGYTYIKTENPDGEILGRIPEHEFNLGVNGETDFGLTYGLTAKLVRGVEDNVNGTISDLDDYNLVNASLGYKLGNGEIYLRSENIFDEEYQTATGYGTSDRAFYVGYRVDF